MTGFPGCIRWPSHEKTQEAPPARGTKRRVMTARLRLHWFRVLASVGMSSKPDEIIAPSLTLTNAYEISNIISCPEHCQNDTKEMIQT